MLVKWHLCGILHRWCFNQVLKMDYSLTIKLAFSLFSFDSGNMRYFNVRRILISLLLVPVFILCFFINRFFLLLDHVFFPSFKRQIIRNPVFIVAAPRSGTTYLFHTLAKDQTTFTAFKLWEIILAPSIIQKYFFGCFLNYSFGNI